MFKFLALQIFGNGTTDRITKVFGKKFKLSCILSQVGAIKDGHLDICGLSRARLYEEPIFTESYSNLDYFAIAVD